MNPDLIGQLTIVAGLCALVAGTVVVADILPARPSIDEQLEAASRPEPVAPPTRDLPVVFIDTQGRRALQNRALAARAHHRLDLERQLARLTSVRDDVIRELEEHDQATAAVRIDRAGGAR